MLLTENFRKIFGSNHDVLEGETEGGRQNLFAREEAFDTASLNV